MTFLNPVWLWGLLAVGAPILIHLLSRRGMKTSRWAAVEFLQRALQAQKRRLRIEDVLLLAIRCLAVAMVAVLFAQPGCERRESANRVFSNPVSAMLVMDNSASASQTDGRQSRLDVLKDEALEFLRTLPAGSKAGVVLSTDAGRALLSPPTSDLGRVRRTIATIQPTSIGGDLPQSIRTAMETLKAEGEALPTAMLVFSDVQAVEFANPDQIQASIGVHPAAQVKFFPIGDRGEANIGITSLEATSGAFVNRPLGVVARLQNFSDKAVTNIRVTLSMNGEPPSAEVVISEILPGGSALAEFKTRPEAAGPLILTAEIPADLFATDNRRSLAIEVGAQRRALLVANPPDVAPGSAAFFLANAIVPFAPEERDGAPWRADVVGTEALKDLADNPPDLVALLDIASIDGETSKRLSDYVRAGGALMVFAGQQFDPSAYSTSPVWQQLLPAMPGAIENAGAADVWKLQGRPFHHPITSFWDEPASGDLSLVAADKRRALAPVGADGDFSTILAYADGRPAWIEADRGKGKVLLGVLMPDVRWSNLPLHPSFVGIVQRTLDFLTRNSGASLNLQPGQEFRIPATMEWLTREFRVKALDGSGATRVGGQVEPGDAGASIRYRATNQPGGYQIFLAGQENPISGFAVQPDPQESDLRQIERSVLKGWEEGSGGGVASAAEPLLTRPPVVDRVGWVPLVLVLLTLLLLDQSFAMFLSRRRPA